MGGEPKPEPSGGGGGGGEGRRAERSKVRSLRTRMRTSKIHGAGRRSNPLLRAATAGQDSVRQGRRTRGGEPASWRHGARRDETYLKPGDLLAIDLDPAANRLLGLNVNSYVDEPDEPVTLAVQMATLPDGALYAGKTTLE